MDFVYRISCLYRLGQGPDTNEQAQINLQANKEMPSDQTRHVDLIKSWWTQAFLDKKYKPEFTKVNCENK